VGVAVGRVPVYYLECVAAGRRELMLAPSGNLLGLRRRQPGHARGAPGAMLSTISPSNRYPIIYYLFL
jgi:hypothetical protein